MGIIINTHVSTELHYSWDKTVQRLNAAISPTWILPLSEN